MSLNSTPHSRRTFNASLGKVESGQDWRRRRRRSGRRRKWRRRRKIRGSSCRWKLRMGRKHATRSLTHGVKCCRISKGEGELNQLPLVVFIIPHDRIKVNVKPVLPKNDRCAESALSPSPLLCLYQFSLLPSGNSNLSFQPIFRGL